MADITPVNYDVAVLNPTQALMQGLQAGGAVYDQAQKVNAQQQAQLQAQQYQRDVASLANNPAPTPQDYANFTLKYPQVYQAAKQAADQSDQSQKDQNIGLISRVAASLQNGDTDTASQIMQDHVNALKSGNASQQTIQAAQSQADLITQHPDFAKNHFNLLAAGLLGADKYVQNFSGLNADQRAQQLQPATVQKANADATTAQATADVAPAAAQQGLRKTEADIANIRSEAANRAAQYGLDAQKAQNDFDLKMAELQGKQTQLEPGMAKMQADAIGTSTQAQSLADKADLLANDFLKDRPVGGIAGYIGQKWGDAFGTPNALRQQFNGILSQASLGLLPPGSASDKDIALLRQGFPGDNASADQVATWLKTFAKAQRGVQLRDEAKADWISQNKDLGNAKGDISVSGITVPKGTTFTYFIKKALTPDAIAKASPQTSDLSTRSYMKYGQ